MAEISPIRVRFAPSPTGRLHIGNARTALFNWLFARNRAGTMVLRIEDTDVERSEARFEQQLIDDLKWLGLDWEEGPDRGGPYSPYRQSDRLPIYQDYAQQLVRAGKAYRCFCSEAELDSERKRAQAEHRQPLYSGKCRNLDPAEAEQRQRQGELCAIRLRIPVGAIRFEDQVHGQLEFSHEVVSDPILVRSTGMPVYNYVVVIDDGLMKISHVIRGDDHLSNTPKQVAIYQALGWPVPLFAHLSTILASDRERLSKRHGATSLANFREMGILPEALMNYLALLGWAPTGGTREIFTPPELVEAFSLERVTPSPAVFDMEKLYWLNRHYIKLCPISRLLSSALEFFQAADLLGPDWGEPTPELPDGGKEDFRWEWFRKVVELLAPSVDRLDQLPERGTMIFSYDAPAALAAPDNGETLSWANSRAVLARFTGKIIEDESAREGRLTPAQFKKIVSEVKAETGAKGKELFHPIRIVITGSHSGPEFDKLIPILEEGSHLPLPKHVLSVRERVEQFGQAMAL